jgi:hypothetical protein
MTDRQIYDAMARDTITNGGGTFARDAYRHVTLPNRYIVALGKPWARVASGYESRLQIEWLLSDHLRELANIMSPWLSSGGFDPNPKALGTWINPATGLGHVDIVESYWHGGYALRLARERGQLAIFDSVARVDIPVPAT